jgi:hypothetical protein
MMKKVLSIAALVFIITAGTAFAHEHKVLGTVTMSGPGHVMMKTTDGHDVTVKINAATKITRGKDAVKADAINEGTRIVVLTASDVSPYTAMAIEVGATVKPSKK